MISPIIAAVGRMISVVFALPPSLVNAPVSGTGTFSSSSSSSVFGSTILKVADAR